MPVEDVSPPLEARLRIDLLRIAREAIALGIGKGQCLLPDLSLLPGALASPRASFVTLSCGSRLRGCIGSLEAFRPLAHDVADNAYAAAFRDPRFPPVIADELPKLVLELSLLTQPEPISFDSEAQLRAILRPGIDGVILVEGRLRGTFLPSVWEQLPDPSDFLRHLKLKTGLTENHRSSTLRAYRYRVERVVETNGDAA